MENGLVEKGEQEVMEMFHYEIHIHRAFRHQSLSLTARVKRRSDWMSCEMAIFDTVQTIHSSVNRNTSPAPTLSPDLSPI
jgi:hypothetical protein